MNKNRIRLTESQLHNIIKQSVRKILNEGRGSFGGIVDMVTESLMIFICHIKTKLMTI